MMIDDDNDDGDDDDDRPCENLCASFMRLRALERALGAGPQPLRLAPLASCDDASLLTAED